MRILKLWLVLFFFASAAVPAISNRFTALGIGSTPPKPVLAETPETAPADPDAVSPVSTDPSHYVGSAACVECHANQVGHYNTSAHRKTYVPDAKADRIGCEACHGGAKMHVEYYKQSQQLMAEGKDTEAQALLADESKSKAAQMVALDKLSSAAASAVCLKCHEGSQGRAKSASTSAAANTSDTASAVLIATRRIRPSGRSSCCAMTSPKLLQVPSGSEGRLRQPFHHKVPEGAIKCSDCHNQHGGFQTKQQRSCAGNDDSCLKCHTDKQGPFAFEHAPLKVEGCQACHTPHGSTNAKLLKRNEVRFLCLECHSNAPGIPTDDGTGFGIITPRMHDITNPAVQNCTNCHFSIHGSNIDPFLRR